MKPWLGSYGVDLKNLNYELYLKELINLPTSHWDWEKQHELAHNLSGMMADQTVSN